MEVCADCGKSIEFGQGSYYRRLGDNSDIGQTFHSGCGDPFGLKAKDARIARLEAALELISGRLIPIEPNEPESFMRYMSAKEMQEIAEAALKCA